MPDGYIITENGIEKIDTRAHLEAKPLWLGYSDPHVVPETEKYIPAVSSPPVILRGGEGAALEEPEKKDTNPKDAIGCKKAPISTVPAQVIAEIGLGMLEGAIKYRRHNYRIAGVRASIYYDATMRHLMQWWEGQDIDPDSNLNHITKALASLTVLRDAMIQDKLNDDRPPRAKNVDWMKDLNAEAKRLLEKSDEHAEPYTQKDGAK